jgi:hypothetical protein
MLPLKSFKGHGILCLFVCLYVLFIIRVYEHAHVSPRRNLPREKSIKNVSHNRYTVEVVAPACTRCGWSPWQSAAAEKKTAGVSCRSSKRLGKITITRVLDL